MQMNARLCGRPETEIEKGDVAKRLNERVSAVHHMNLALLNRQSAADKDKMYEYYSKSCNLLKNSNFFRAFPKRKLDTVPIENETMDEDVTPQVGPRLTHI